LNFKIIEYNIFNSITLTIFKYQMYYFNIEIVYVISHIFNLISIKKCILHIKKSYHSKHFQQPSRTLILVSKTLLS